MKSGYAARSWGMGSPVARLDTHRAQFDRTDLLRQRDKSVAFRNRAHRLGRVSDGCNHYMCRRVAPRGCNRFGLCQNNSFLYKHLTAVGWRHPA